MPRSSRTGEIIFDPEIEKTARTNRRAKRLVDELVEPTSSFNDTGGDGELEFNEDDEEDDKGYDENRKFDEFEGNDVGLFASAEYDEDDKEADAV
ncbi:hypothetical protein CRG98_020751 [Punica granatum]|uniref:PRP1 splicing factor N-terminal domain-containing protein n=1 Tax=Punica granatum TaxID=22663 RepID=A0A2I0JRE4_PUNGR|nr:hypothetical protein CRG98_020751 [Punica granatum]